MQGHVTILGATPNAAAMIASGGRISTMDGTADEIFAKSLAAGQEKNEKLVAKVVSSGHTSVLEHCYVNLSFENVSVFAEQFLIEFRLASFTVKSRRYVDFSNAGYVFPAFSDSAQKAVFDETVRALFSVYDALEAAGVPKEDARFVLPYCFCSNFFCSMNARELVHVMNELRYGRGASNPELCALGESLFAQCEQKLPFLALRRPEEYSAVPCVPLPEADPLVPEAPVTILSAPENAEKLICDAYQIAQGRVPQALDAQAQRTLLRALLTRPRRRELEQAGFTLLFSGMSLAALTHMTRHRMQALCAPDLLCSGCRAGARLSECLCPGRTRRGGAAGVGRRQERAALSASERPDGACPHDNECRGAVCVLPSALLQPRPVGDPRLRGCSAGRAAGKVAGAVFSLWPDLRGCRALPGGEDDLRPAGRDEKKVRVWRIKVRSSVFKKVRPISWTYLFILVCRSARERMRKRCLLMIC